MKATVQRCDFSIGARKSTRKLTKITETSSDDISHMCLSSAAAARLPTQQPKNRCVLGARCPYVVLGFIYYGRDHTSLSKNHPMLNIDFIDITISFFWKIYPNHWQLKLY